MAFQGNSFQNNAFQLPTDPPTDLHGIIHDGNETVAILNETNQHIDYLGTISTGQPLLDAGLCRYPEADVTSGTSSGTTLPLPSPENGDLILVFTARGFAGTPTTVPSGWVQLDVGSNRLRTFYKVCDGTEGSSTTLQPDGSASNYLYSIYKIKAGTYQGVPEGTFTTVASATTATPPTHAASWGSDYGMWFVAAGKDNNATINGTPTGYDYAPVTISSGPVGATIGTRAKQTISASESPSDWSFSGTSQTRVCTVVVRGYCEPTDPLSIVDCDNQDFTDSSEYGWVNPPLDDSQEECLFPVVTSVTAGSDLTTGTSHVITFTASNGDGVLVVFATNGNTHTATAGWTEVVDNESVVSYWRIIDGTEGGTMTITSSASSESVWYVYRIQAGTFDPSTTPAAATTLNSATQDPPNLSWGWTDKTLVFAAIAGDTATSPITFTSGPSELTDGFNAQETGGIALPDCYLAVKYGGFDGSSLNPSAFVITAQSSNYDLATIAIRGNCRKQQSIIALDEQDFTDAWDYGFEVEPLSEDVVAESPILLGDGQGLDNQDWTDFADYSSQSDQPIDDNNPEVAPSALDEQDFTDTADYSFSADPLSSDNNPEVAPAAIALDNQDFTDFADYGFNWNAPADLDEQDPDLGQIDCDSQDFTDTADYSYVVDPAIPDNNPDVAPSALDEQDFTDTTDYSFVGPQPIDDFVLIEEFALGLGYGLDEQDFTDTQEYGFSVDPLAGDVVDFNLGTGAGLDEQDFTDTADYGFSIDPPIPDNNPEVAPSALDDQDFTDREDYSYTTPVLSEDGRDDAPLGTIHDSCDEIVNYFDLSDYSYIVYPNINDTSVLLPSFTVYVLPSDACQLVVITWNYTTEPSPSWLEITQPSSSWSEVAQPAASWLAISEPSASWSIIIDATEINWNQVC